MIFDRLNKNNIQKQMIKKKEGMIKLHPCNFITAEFSPMAKTRFYVASMHHRYRGVFKGELMLILVKVLLGLALIGKGIYGATNPKKEEILADLRAKHGDKGEKLYYASNVILPIVAGVIFMIPAIIIPMLY